MRGYCKALWDAVTVLEKRYTSAVHLPFPIKIFLVDYEEDELKQESSKENLQQVLAKPQQA